MFEMIKIRTKSLSSIGIPIFILLLLILFAFEPCMGEKLTEITDTYKIIDNNEDFERTLFDIPQESWNRTFGGTNVDRGVYVEQTNDGGYIITGETWSYGNGAYDIWLIKTDSKGNEEWNKTFGGENDEMGTSIHSTIDGGYIITGKTNSYGVGNSDVWLIKTDAFGNEEWNKTFGNEFNDWGWSVQQTIDNGYIITGISEPFSEDIRDLWLIKTDSFGNEKWNKTYGGVKNEYGYSVQQTTDGGYLILGETNSYGSGSGDVWLIKTDVNGTEDWNKTFGGIDQDSGISMQIIENEGYIILGITWSFGLDSGDVWLIKTDIFGNEQWNRTFGGTSYDCGASIDITDDGEFIICAITETFGAGEGDVWLIKTDSSGNEKWNKTFGGTDYDCGYSVQYTDDGGFIICGCTKSYGVGNEDVWLIKVEIIAELRMTFLFGYVTNITLMDDFIKFKAQNVFYIVFKPKHYGSLSNEEIIAKQVLALTIPGNPGIIFGFYKTYL